MADDGQTAEALGDRDMGEMPVGHSEKLNSNDEHEAAQAEQPASIDSTSEENDKHVSDADAMRTQTQIELDHVEYIGDYFDALIYSPSNMRKKQLDADIEKLNSEIEGLQQRAEKVIEDKKLREKAKDATHKKGEAAQTILMGSIAQNVDEDKQESAQGAAYTALLNIAKGIKDTLKKDYATNDQPFELGEDDRYPVKDILPALALHLFEDGNIQNADDLSVLSSAEEISETTAAVIASYENAIAEEQNKKNKRLKKLRSDIAKKNDEIARKNEEKQEIAPEAIQEERAEFLRARPALRNSLNSLGQYKKSLDIALEAPSAEAYFAGNEDVLAIFNHMDSELGDDADAIALKRNDDRKRYFITLKNLDEEHFDELVREAQYDMAKLADLRAKDEVEENPLWTEEHYDVTDLIDQDREVVSQNYIPAVETLDKLASSVSLNTAAPQQKTESADADETDGDANAQEEMAPVNYTSFTQHKQRAEHAIAALTNSLSSEERGEYDAYMARIEERGTEDFTEEQLETTEVARQYLLKRAEDADAKLAKLRPNNTPMLRRASIMGHALTLADETDADNHFKNAENSKIIDLLNKKIENAESEEQKGEYETLKKMMVAASSVDTSQAEEGSPISIMQNLRDDVDALRAKAEENGEDADVTDEKIVDAVRSHMDAMIENYLPTEKQLKKAQKTTLGNRIKSLVQRVTGTRNKVKKELTEPTISDEQMNAAIDKLVEPESDHEIDPENDDLPEESADDHDDLLFANEEDDRLEPEDDQDPDASDAEEKLDSESDPFGLFEEQDDEAEQDNDEPEQPDLPLEDEEKAVSGDELDNDEPVDAEFDESGTGKPMRKDDDQEPVDAEYYEVEETEDPDQDDELEASGKEKESSIRGMAKTAFMVSSAGLLGAAAMYFLGADADVASLAKGTSGGVAALALINGLRNDPTKTILTVGSTVAISMLAKGALLGAAAAIPFIPGIVATMGVFAVASALGGMGAAIVGNILEKARGNKDAKLTDGLFKSALRGAAFGAFAGALGLESAGDGADNALAGGQNTDLTANGAENAGLSGGEPEQTLAPDPEASIEPGAGVNNDLAGNADLTEVSGPDFGDMSAVEIREAAGVMYTEGDYQGALDALNVALEKAPDWLDESIQGDIANIAMVHGLETGTEGFDSASDMLRSSFAEAGQEGHGRNEDYLRMLMEKRDLLSPSGPSMS